MFKNKSLFFYILIFFTLQNSYSLNLTTSFNLGNLGFNRDSSSSEMATTWGTEFLAKQSVDKNFSLIGGLIIDDITGNRMDSKLVFSGRYFQIGLGPSIASFNNSLYQVKPGINGSFLVKKEGSFFLMTKLYSSIGNLSDQYSDYSQMTTYLAFGFYVPGALCTFSVENKQFSRFETKSDSTISKTTDVYYAYQLEADIHKKNIPFHIVMTMGYKDLQRIFPEADPSGRSTAAVGSVFIGIGTIINFNRHIMFRATAENGLYNFSYNDEIANTDIPDYLFNIKSSLVYKF